MAKVTFLCPSHLSRTPRVLRNVEALAAAGHLVSVVWANHLPEYLPYDRALTSVAHWKPCPVDFVSGPTGWRKAQWSRIRRKLFSLFPVRSFTPSWVLERAFGYFGPELAKAVIDTKPDMVIAQQQTMLTPATRAARHLGALLAIDVEDLLAECDTEPVSLIRETERRFLPTASFITTMSQVSADYLKAQHSLKRAPVVLHNCPHLNERKNLLPPAERSCSPFLRLYWFGQTIGPHSCAEEILKALPLLKAPAVLTLRGFRSAGSYTASLRRIAAEIGMEHALSIQEGAAPNQMVRLASQHNVCFGTQPGLQLFHRLAIGNKVFTGMMAGCAVAMTDTPAHQHLLKEHGGWGFTFGENNSRSLAEQLNVFITDPARLLAMQSCAWDLASSFYNWETESSRLTTIVSESLKLR